jgi:hypothetical protein
MKKLSVWLGVLILAGALAAPAFAAQRPSCCPDPEESRTFTMRTDQEPLPWETPGGKVQGRTATSLSE